MKNSRTSVGIVSGLAMLASLVSAVEAACPDMDIQAHRGAPGYPENTIYSVAAALDNPAYTAVEIDVYALGDGYHVLHHDPVPTRLLHNVPQKPIHLLNRTEWERARVYGQKDMRPSFLGETLDVFANHRHAHQKINIEIKDDFDSGNNQCARMRQLHQQIADLLPAGSWAYSTPHLGVMQCMANLHPQVYVGYVAMPTQEELVTQHRPKLETAYGLLADRVGSGLANQAARLASKAYGEATQRHFLSPERREQISSYLSGRGGVHLGIGMIEENFYEIRELAQNGLAVYVYGVNGDASLASGLRRLRDQGLKISGAIIDEDPEAFCAMLN